MVFSNSATRASYSLVIPVPSNIEALARLPKTTSLRTFTVNFWNLFLIPVSVRIRFVPALTIMSP